MYIENFDEMYAKITEIAAELKDGMYDMSGVAYDDVHET